MDERFFCSTTEAARILGVSIRTVQAWVDKGALTAWKTVGGHRRVLLESVNRLKAMQGEGDAAPVGAVKKRMER
ncbi:MAG: helix-turn-helix domain-containing protein [Sulfuricellaceae bacterium]|jgi:excisionase family DNA binding protein